MEIIAEITTSRAEENQELGLIVPGDHTAPISPRIGDLLHLDLHAPASIFPRIEVVDPDRLMLPGTILRSAGSLTRIAAHDGHPNGPDHVSRKRNAPPARATSTLAQISGDATGARTATGMIWTPIPPIHHAAGLTPIRSIKTLHAAGLTPIRSIRSPRVIARKPVTHACGKTTTGARGERRTGSVGISSRMTRRRMSGEMR